MGKDSPIWACPNAMVLTENCAYALCNECFHAKVGQFQTITGTLTRKSKHQKCNHETRLDPYVNPIHFDENSMQRARNKGLKCPDKCSVCKRRIAVKSGYKNI